jgi:hypothetical protein
MTRLITRTNQTNGRGRHAIIGKCLLALANRYPRDTGLPMTIWVVLEGAPRHDGRAKVFLGPADRTDARNTAAVAICPVPRLNSGALPARDFDLVARWIAHNSEALIDYWNGALGTIEFV